MAIFNDLLLLHNLLEDDIFKRRSTTIKALLKVELIRFNQGLGVSNSTFRCSNFSNYAPLGFQLSMRQKLKLEVIAYHHILQAFDIAKAD